MTDRILDISESAARISMSLSRLVVERDAGPPVTVPLGDVAVLLLGHPQISCTQPALAGVVEHGGAVIACDAKRRPVGMMLPLVGNSTQVARMLVQAHAAVPTKKRLWQSLVRAKLEAQAGVLMELTGSDAGISLLAARVRSGDPENREAQAAQRYWPRLFDEPRFRRRREAEDQNALLNYGYAVVRAAIGRAICSAGLNPSLGVHHHNKYNPFCLADDLLEPFRPLVDREVVQLLRTAPDGPVVVDRQAKAALIRVVTGRYFLDGEERSFFELLSRLATNLARVYAKEEPTLRVPTLWHVPRRD